MARSATQASGTLRFAGVRIRMRIEDGARKDHATRSQLAARAAPAAFPLRLAVAVWSQWHWTRRLACGLSQLPQRDSLIARRRR